MLKNLSQNKKTVISNISSLIVLQGTMYLIPLILLPYLIRVLGIENFGLLAFATATIAFFRGVVEYGFNLTGTQQISLYKNDKNKINTIFSSIIISKFLLAISCFIILCFMIFTFDKFQSHANIFLFTFIIIFGDILFPIWFFQGIEKMKTITYIFILYKVIFIFLVILLVKEENDYILVPVFDSIGSIIAATISLILIKVNYNVTFRMIKMEDILYQFKDSWHVFLSRISVILYTSINTFLLGLLTTNEEVGIYSIAEKIYMAIRGLMNPFVQALFPFLNRKYEESKLLYYKLVKKVSIVYFLILLFLSIILFTFNKELIYLIANKEISESAEILKIFAIAVLFAVGTLYSNLLVIKNKKKLLTKITFIGMFVNLILVYHAISLFGIFGLAYLFLLVQLIQTCLQIKYNYEIWSYKNATI